MEVIILLVRAVLTKLHVTTILILSDDGSCEYLEEFIIVKATTDVDEDGVCDELEVLGCTALVLIMDIFMYLYGLRISL